MIKIFILTLHRLQKWNSSFSAACRLMDSSESGNSVLNGASTCFTCADWACEWECVCLSALPAVWLPLPQPQLTCPASAFLTRLLYTQERHGKRTGEGGGCAGVRVADRASLPGNRDRSSRFTNAHHLPCVSTYQGTQQQVFFFYLKRTLWHKSD